MAEKKQKILILDYDSDTTAAVGDIFSKHYDTVTVASLEEASKKANDGKYDIIITGYVIPAVSGKKAISYLKNIKTAISKAKKAAQNKSAAAQKLLRQSRDKQDEILDMLNENISGVENKRAALEQKIQSMMEEIDTARNSKTETEKKTELALEGKQKAEEKLEAALEGKQKAEAALEGKQKAEEKLETALEGKQKAEEKLEAALEGKQKAEAALKDKQKAEEKLEAALEGKQKAEEIVETVLTEKTKMIEEFDRLNNEINSLKKEINNSASLAEEAYKEKAEMEDKLTKLQKNWEKYM